MELLKRFERKLALLLDTVIASFFAVILLITILQVILRYVFNESIIGGNELMEGLFIYTTAIGAAVAVRRRQHISISFVVQLLPKFLQRLDEVLVHALIAFLNGVMIFYSMRWISRVGSNESPVLRVPEWIFQISIPVGCCLVIVYCIVMILLAFSEEPAAREDASC